MAHPDEQLAHELNFSASTSAVRKEAGCHLHTAEIGFTQRHDLRRLLPQYVLCWDEIMRLPFEYEDYRFAGIITALSGLS